MHDKIIQRQYGLWDSPISAISMARGQDFSDVAWGDDGVLAWREQRSDMGVIKVQAAGEDAGRDLNSDYSVRAKVGYGGGDFTLGHGHLAEMGQGRHAKALRLNAAATGIAKANEFIIPEESEVTFVKELAHQHIVSTRHKVGELLTMRYEEEGRTMSLAEVVEYALDVETD